MEKIKGIVPAFMTPFDENDQIDEQMARRLVRFMIDSGSAGFFVCGSTGEGFLMSVEERKQYLELVVNEVAGQVPVIAQVGALATRDSLELARHAQKIGADAVGSVAPFYYPHTFEAIMDHYRLIGDSVDLPVYVYYIPLTTGVKLSADQFIDGINKVPGIAGLKFSDANLYMFNLVIQAAAGKLNVFSGFDEMLLPALIMGADGAIGLDYNMFPDLFVGIYNDFYNNRIKEAQEKQFRVNTFIKTMLAYGYLPFAKYAMKYRGFNMERCRRPFVPFTDEHKKLIETKLKEIGFFDWPEIAK